MKALIINGSPRVNGNISIAIDEMARTFHAEGIISGHQSIKEKSTEGMF